jgi:AcrR family transcriptional regulator
MGKTRNDVRAENKEKKSGRSYGGQSTEERQTMRRGRFVDAGRVVFAREGFHATTVKALCQEAGLTERYFYESYSSRDVLFMQVCTSVAEELRASIMRALGEVKNGADAFVLTRAALHECCRVFLTDPTVARLLLFECVGVSDEINRRYYRALDEFAQFLLALAVPWAERGEFRLQHPEFVPVGLVGAVQHIVIRWNLNGYAQELNEVVDAIFAIFAAVMKHFR